MNGPRRRVHDVVGVLDALGDALEGQQLAQPIAGDEARQLLVADFGVDGHGCLDFRGGRQETGVAGRNSRGTLKAMRSSAVVTVSSLTSKRAAERVDDRLDERLGRGGARRHADAFDALDIGPRDVAGPLDEPRCWAAGTLRHLD